MKRVLTSWLLVVLLLAFYPVVSLAEGNCCEDFIVKEDGACCVDSSVGVQACEKMTRYFVNIAETSHLNVRRNPDKESGILYRLYKGDEVKLEKTCDDGWVQISKGGRIGYTLATKLYKREYTCASQAFIEENTTKYFVISKCLRVRLEPCGNAKPIGRLYNDENVYVIEITDNGWARIVFDKNVLGYVDMKFLRTYQAVDE